jgi:hypothetical protein
LPIARLQALALSALEHKQFALLRTVQPPAALLRRLNPVEALLGVFQAPLFALLRAFSVLFLSFESTRLPTLSPIQIALLQFLLQLFAAILRGFSSYVRLPRNALLHFDLAVLRAQLDSIASGLRTIRHSVTPPERTLLSAVPNALLTLLHALLEMFLPGDTGGGGGRCLTLRRSSRTLRRGRCTDRWSRSRHCGRRLGGPCGCWRWSRTGWGPGTRRGRSAPLLLVRLRGSSTECSQREGNAQCDCCDTNA